MMFYSNLKFRVFWHCMNYPIALVVDTKHFESKKKAATISWYNQNQIPVLEKNKESIRLIEQKTLSRNVVTQLHATAK